MDLQASRYRPRPTLAKDDSKYDEQVGNLHGKQPLDQGDCGAITQDSLSEAIKSLVIMPVENASPPEESAPCTDRDAIDALLDKLKGLGLLVTKEPGEVRRGSYTTERDLLSNVAMRPKSALRVSSAAMPTREYKLALLRRSGWKVADIKYRRFRRQPPPSNTNAKDVRGGSEGSGARRKGPKSAGYCPLAMKNSRVRKTITRRSH